jgi:putative ABC transport system substrate-binding protein
VHAWSDRELDAAFASVLQLRASYRLPAIYAFWVYVAGGGLSFYGPQRHRAILSRCGYVDRVLKGEKPGDLQ